MGGSRLAATAEQVEVWLAAQREPDSGRFNIPLDLEFTGVVDARAVRAALGDLTARHPSLRSCFVTESGELVRVVAEDPAPRFVSHRRKGPYARDTALAWAAQVAAQPFDLSAAPLVRGALLEFDDGALFVLTVHHVVSDGWSQQILLKDFLTACEARMDGRVPDWPNASAGEPGSTETEAEVPAETLAHWRALLSGSPATLAPPTDLIRPDSAPGAPAYAETVVPGELLCSIRTLAATQGATPAQILLTAWLCLLHAWSAHADGTTGMLFAARLAEHSQDRVDLLARVLPVRSAIDRADRFQDVLDRVQDQALDSLEHSEIPSDRLRELRAESDTGLTHDTCVFLHFPEVEAESTVSGLRVRAVEHEVAGAKYDFALAALEGGRHLRLRIDYDSALYRSATVELFLNQLVALLGAAVAAPDSTVLSLLAGCDPEADPAREPASAPDDASAFAEQALVHDWVLRQAAERPDAVAVRSGEDILTYRELVSRAAQLAHWLGYRGVGSAPGRHDVVALLLPPGADTVVFWLASVLAGAAYLPLEPSHPDGQLQRVVADAAPVLLVVAPELAGRVATMGVPVHLSTQALAEAGSLPTEPPSVPIGPDTPFNLLYTSGSTGRPKGVVLPHRGVARLMHRPDFVPLDHTDVVSQLSPLNFDGATYETWGALTHGAALVVLERESVLSPRVLAEDLRTHAVTTLLVTTPLLNRLIDDAPDILGSLRRVYFGGEAISVPHMRRALRWCEPGTLLHGYGPTENSFTSTWLPVTEVPDNTRTLPIGRPVPGTTAHVVLDVETMTPAPRGVPGELLLGGTGVALGYLGDPEGTARRYLPDPGDARPGALLYRTGDRVRRTPTGELEFIGRDDNQVKIRSQRIELGDVESVLAAHEGVDAVTVTVCRNERDEKELAAYLVLNPLGSPESVRQHARSALPAYAVPRFLVPLAEMPLNANGKVDRRRLPEPPLPRSRKAATAVAAAPATTPRPRATRPAAGSTDRTVRVRAAWREVLGHDEFGVEDNFFDVGGHSLILVRLQQQLERQLGGAPSISDLLRHTTVRAQAQLGAASPETGGGAGTVTRVATPAAPASTTPPLTREWFALPLSARTPEALTAARLGLADHMRLHPQLHLGDVAHTLSHGRESFSHRLTVVARDLASALAALTEPTRPGDARLVSGTADHRVPPQLVLAIGDLVSAEADPVGAAAAFSAAHTLALRLTEHGAVPAAVCGHASGALVAAAATEALALGEAARLFSALAASERTPSAPAGSVFAPTGDGHTPLFLSPSGGGSIASSVARAVPDGPSTVVGIGLDAGDRAALQALPQVTLVDAESWREQSEADLLCLLAELWCSGAAPADVSAGATGKRVRLPGYPFQRGGLAAD